MTEILIFLLGVCSGLLLEKFLNRLYFGMNWKGWNIEMFKLNDSERRIVLTRDDDYCRLKLDENGEIDINYVATR